MGANAIWISPIVANTDDGYHGYWLKDLNQINPHFGTEDDLHDLVSACHAKDIWVMVDVVGNHVGPVGTDYSQINPFNKAEYYHDSCVISDSDFLNNQHNVEVCRLAGLPDLNQDNAFVRSTLLNWIQNLVTIYSLDGIRIDTIPEVEHSFWQEFSKSAGVFTLGEVFDGRKNYVAGYQGDIDATLNYPLYFKMKDVFLSGHAMNEIEGFYHDMQVFKDQSVLGCFIDNHDNARFLSMNNDLALFRSYITFNLGALGIPIIYYGSEQGFAGAGDPHNREAIWNNFDSNHQLYKYIQTILKARSTIQWHQEQQIQRYSDADFYAFSRGKALFAFTNKKGQVVKTVTSHPYQEADILCNVFDNTDCITVKNKQFNVYLNNGEAKIFVPKGSLGEARYFLSIDE